MGRRLGLTGQQKCLAPTAGRPFLHWRLDQLVECGATELTLLINHRGADIWNSCGETWQGITVNYLSDSTKIRNPWDCVRQAVRTYGHEFPATFHVAFGDVYCPILLTDGPTPTMWVTDQSPHEPMNVHGEFLDTGLYRVSTENPVPTGPEWRHEIVHHRTYQLNTREAWKEADAFLCRHGSPSRD